MRRASSLRVYSPCLVSGNLSSKPHTPFRCSTRCTTRLCCLSDIRLNWLGKVLCFFEDREHTRYFSVSHVIGCHTVEKQNRRYIYRTCRQVLRCWQSAAFALSHSPSIHAAIWLRVAFVGFVWWLLKGTEMTTIVFVNAPMPLCLCLWSVKFVREPTKSKDVSLANDSLWPTFPAAGWSWRLWACVKTCFCILVARGKISGSRRTQTTDEWIRGERTRRSSHRRCHRLRLAPVIAHAVSQICVRARVIRFSILVYFRPELRSSVMGACSEREAGSCEKSASFFGTARSRYAALHNCELTARRLS